MPDQPAKNEQHKENQPVISVSPNKGIVRTDHGEYDRERQVVVVHRSLFSPASERRIGVAVFKFGRNELFLGRNDDPEHISRHDRPEHGADL